ncbi:MAG: TetR/AcrR family transcriptional regulator [Balneolaceae bacterium]|nr:TetR/AcrR family transcriptional regulator [Balneolaceae bacterium]
MTNGQKETEDQIFEAATKVFQEKGYAGARMQEIADEAEINKSMLHYYFRSKEKLFRQVLQKQIGKIFPTLFNVLSSENPLDEKVREMIEVYYSYLKDNPSLPQFVVMEMNNHPDEFRKFLQEEGISPPQGFIKQIQVHAVKGEITPIDPRQFIISIVGLILFPFLAQTMIKTVFNLDEAGYMQFLKERKDFLADFILNAIKFEAP